jgi:hypothetical protein
VRGVRHQRRADRPGHASSHAALADHDRDSVPSHILSGLRSFFAATLLDYTGS